MVTMENPFVFGKIAEKEHFINRSNDIARLQNNFRNGINTILISPRRWGKTSVVLKSINLMQNEDKFRFCYLDLFGIRTEQEFYKRFAHNILKSTSNKWQEAGKILKDFLSSLRPKISLGTQENEFSLDFDWRDDSKDIIEEILNLPEKIAEKKKIKIVVCLDEFQNITSFGNAEAFQKILRSYWQHHQQTTYCLFGSKRSMMVELFESKKMPFYRFGDTFYMQKIAETHWIPFIEQAFARTNKQILIGEIEKILRITDLHPFYVQQIAFWVWLKTEKKVNETIINEALEQVIAQNEPLYQREAEGLSVLQINLLKAIYENVSNLTAKQNLDKYELGTSASVIKNRRVLELKEIIDVGQNTISFEDPLFRIWFGKVFL
jgi:hypothetical protein